MKQHKTNTNDNKNRCHFYVKRTVTSKYPLKANDKAADLSSAHVQSYMIKSGYKRSKCLHKVAIEHKNLQLKIDLSLF